MNRQDFTKSQKWMLVGVGLLAAVAGAVSVFLTENGLGSASLVIGGLGAVVLALTGRLVRFKFGDTEMEWEAEVLEEVGEELSYVAMSQEQEGDSDSASQLSQLSDRLALIEKSFRRSASSEGRPETQDAGSQRSRVDEIRRLSQSYEQWLTSVAQEAVEGWEGTLIDRQWRGAAGAWDLSIGTPSGQILIEGLYRKADPEFSKASIFNMLRTRLGAAAAELVARPNDKISFLIVTNAPTDRGMSWLTWPDAVDSIEILTAEQSDGGRQVVIQAIQEALDRMDEE